MHNSEQYYSNGQLGLGPCLWVQYYNDTVVIEEVGNLFQYNSITLCCSIRAFSPNINVDAHLNLHIESIIE